MLPTGDQFLDQRNAEHGKHEHVDDPRQTQPVLDDKEQEDNTKYRYRGKHDPACIRVDKRSHGPGHAIEFW
jgi:hypothetical protein